MAYTFDQINGLMSGQGQQKADIFASSPQDTAQSGGQPPAAAGGGGSGQVAKTSTEGEMAPSSSGGGASQGGVKAQPSQGGAAQSDILDKNKFQEQPGFTNEIKGNISKAQGDLQNEANTYLSNQTAKGGGGASKATVDQALGGDDASYAQVQKSLYNNNPTADQYQSGVNTDFSKLDTLNNQNSLQQYLKQKGPETYNQGLASLDSTLLSRDPQFQQGLKEAKAQRDALQQVKQNYQTNLTGQAQTALDQAATKGKQETQGYLNQRLQGLQGTMAQEAAAENSARATGRNAPNQDYLNQQVQKAYGELSQNSPELAPYLEQNGVRQLNSEVGNPKTENWANQFYKGAGDVSASQAATGNDVYNFNRLESLLNNGNRMQFQGAGDRNGVDYNGLKNKMVALAQEKKRQADIVKAGQDQATNMGSANYVTQSIGG